MGDKLTDPSIKTLFTIVRTIHETNGCHSLIIMRQITTKASNDYHFREKALKIQTKPVGWIKMLQL